MHSLVSHCNSVADSGNAKEKRITSARVDTFFNKSFKVAHAYMPGNDVCKACGDTYKRLVYFSPGYSGSI